MDRTQNTKARILDLRGGPVTCRGQVPVVDILTQAAQGKAVPDLLEQFPDLEAEDIQAAFLCAADSLRQGQNQRASDVIEPTSDNHFEEFDMYKVLIVDDLSANLKLARLMFHGSEFQVILAQGAEEALEKVIVERPFLVLTDIQMPTINGLELCQRLKADARTENIAVIFITAHERRPEQISEGLNLGGDDYILRPFERSELLARVRAVARLKYAEREARRQARLAEARNQELRLLNDLALAAGSTTVLQDILRVSTQRLVSLLDVKMVALLLLDQQRHVLTVNLVDQQGEFSSLPVDFVPEGEHKLLAVQEQSQAIVRNLYQNLEGGDPHCVVKVVPMASREQVLGALAVVCPSKQTLTTSDWMLLNSAAGLITVALENAHLFQSVQQQVADLTVLNEIGRALTSTLEQEKVLARATQLVQEVLQVDVASVWLLERDQPVLKLVAMSGPGAQVPLGSFLPLELGIAGRVVRTGQPYISLNTNEDELYFSEPAEMGEYVPGSLLCVPLKLASRTIGALQVLHREVWEFDDANTQLLDSVASLVGIAVENARLFSEVQTFNRHLEQMVAERTRELVEEKEKTEAILASMADGLVVLDADGQVLTANVVAEQMLDFDLSQMQGCSISGLKLEHPLWNQVAAMARAGGSQTNLVDVPDPANPDTPFSIQARSAVIYDETEQVLGTVVVLRDITALKEVERMKARFMAGVTHELKTPLAVIRMNVNNLRHYHGRLSRRKRKALLASAEKQIKLLEQLVEGILELSRLDSGLLQIARRPVNVGELVDSVVEGVAPLAESKAIVLRWQKPEGVILTLGDEVQLERVVRNLVDNAIKYTPDKGLVTVAVSFVSDNEVPYVQISVSDTGIGIPEGHQARIFDRFYRVDPSHTVPGTGLGLSIVKEIVEAHRGTIQVQSVPNKGSTFSVTLPGAER